MNRLFVKEITDCGICPETIFNCKYNFDTCPLPFAPFRESSPAMDKAILQATIKHIEQEMRELKNNYAALFENYNKLCYKTTSYKKSLEKISYWRERCHEYDIDEGNTPRAFTDKEEWGLIEGYAKDSLDYVE